MDLVKSLFDSDETVLFSEKVKLSMFVKRKIISMLPLGIMWILLDVFYIYLTTLNSIADKYWFIMIPIIGFNIIAVLSVYVSIAKACILVEHIGYVFTNKGIYKYDDSGYKNIDVILFEDLIGFEKNKNAFSGFIIRSEFKSIVLNDFKGVNMWYTKIATLLPNQEIKVSKK